MIYVTLKEGGVFCKINTNDSKEKILEILNNNKISNIEVRDYVKSGKLVQKDVVEVKYFLLYGYLVSAVMFEDGTVFDSLDGSFRKGCSLTFEELCTYELKELDIVKINYYITNKTK